MYKTLHPRLSWRRYGNVSLCGWEHNGLSCVAIVSPLCVLCAVVRRRVGRWSVQTFHRWTKTLCGDCLQMRGAVQLMTGICHCPQTDEVCRLLIPNLHRRRSRRLSSHRVVWIEWVKVCRNLAQSEQQNGKQVVLKDHIAAARGWYSLHITMGRHFPRQNCPFPWGIWGTIM